MPQFTLHRNFVLGTTKGHTIRFKKDTPTHVPDICVPDAVAIGAIGVEGDTNVLPDEEKVAPILSPKERKVKIFEAFTTMKKRADRNDFTASGTPNAKKVATLTGFDLASKERDTYWQEYRTQEQEDKTQTALDQKTLEEAAEADGVS